MANNPNDNIVKTLYLVIKDQTVGLPEHKYWEYVSASMAESGAGVDMREIANKIIQSFPWPIGVEIRRFFSGEKREQNKERLEQALKVAEKATQFIALILLAQLWEETKSKKLTLSADFNHQFQGMLEKPSFGIWAGLVRAIHSMFETNSITPFTDHFANKCFSNKAFIKQVEKLVQIRNSEAHFYNQSDADEVETALTQFLCNIAFLVKYKLVAVSEIEVYKSRLSKVRYKHSLRLLNSPHEDFSSEDKSYDSFFESHAVLLFKDFQSPQLHLNLSPFVIDTSVYLRNQRVEGIKQGIYVYSGKRNDNYVYYFTHSYEQAVMNDLPQFGEIENEFLDLKSSFGI